MELERALHGLPIEDRKERIASVHDKVKAYLVLWPRVRKLEEPKDVGKALSPDEEKRLIDTASSKIRWKMLSTFVHMALLTGMRIGEITALTRGQANLEKRVLTVERAKTESGTGR